MSKKAGFLLVTTLTLLAMCLAATGQTLDKESRYTDSAGKAVIIQNSLPKGMGSLDGGTLGYTNPAGQYFTYFVFWTRVINETETPLELTVKFPAAFPSPYSYLKLFLPPDTMTSDKESSYNYGVTDLKSFLDTNFDKPTMLQRSIGPKEECMFCVVAISSKIGGVIRAGFVLKDHDLSYSIRGIDPQLDSELIPCGQIVTKKPKQ